MAKAVPQVLRTSAEETRKSLDFLEKRRQMQQQLVHKDFVIKRLEKQNKEIHQSLKTIKDLKDELQVAKELNPLRQPPKPQSKYSYFSDAFKTDPSSEAKSHSRVIKNIIMKSSDTVKMVKVTNQPEVKLHQTKVEVKPDLTTPQQFKMEAKPRSLIDIELPKNMDKPGDSFIMKTSDYNNLLKGHKEEQQRLQEKVRLKQHQLD